MATISKITLPSGITYNLRDSSSTELSITSLNLIISSSDWNLNSSNTTNVNNQYYTYSNSISNLEIESKDYIDCIIYPYSMETAINCELCPTVEIADNTITFYATTIPAEDISICCWIIKIQEGTNE